MESRSAVPVLPRFTVDAVLQSFSLKVLIAIGAIKSILNGGSSV